VIVANNTQRETAPEVTPAISVEPKSPEANNNRPVAVEGTNTENIAVQEVKGLFYTVQVGVFSSRIPPSKLNFLQPFFGEAVNNGLVRYSVGMYNDVNLAKQAKKVIILEGISDAFVTAYVNGKRISVAEAQKIEAEGGKTAFATDAMMNKMPYTGSRTSTPARNRTVEEQPKTIITNDQPATPAKTEAPSVTTTETPTVEATPAFTRTFKSVVPLSDTGLVFRVQIGAFKDEVPIDIASKFLKIADKGINHYTADSLTIYVVGGTRDVESINTIKESVIASGLTDAFVVAYRRGEKIPLEEAIQQSNVKY
jgi:cell division septation protein DedD